METWKALGRWISGHMVLIVPLCVATGILVPDLLIPLKPAIPTLFALVTFQNALGNDFQSLARTLRKPGPLLMVIAVLHLFAPLVVRLVAGLIFADDPGTVAGLVLESSVPVGATTVMWSGVYGGNVPLALASMFVSTVLAPFSIPLTLKVLCGASMEVDVLGMIGDMLYMVAIPAIVGVLYNQLSHGRGREKVSPALAPLSSILVPIIIATNATGISSYVLNLTPHLLAVAAFVGLVTVSGFATGVLLARLTKQSDDVAITMMLDCGIRNISAGAVLASNFLPTEALFPVMAATLFQQFIAAVVGNHMSKGKEGR